MKFISFSKHRVKRAATYAFTVLLNPYHTDMSVFYRTAWKIINQTPFTPFVSGKEEYLGFAANLTSRVIQDV